MSRVPKSNSQRQKSARKVRYSQPVSPNATIVAFVIAEFAPADDRWNAQREEVRRLAGLEVIANDKVKTSRETLETSLRVLANSITDANGRTDHDTRQRLFGGPIGELLRSNTVDLVAAIAGAVVELSGPTNVTFNVTALETLKAAFPVLIADNDALVAARQATATATTLALELRQAWDDAYKKVRQCVAFHTRGEQWKDYLLEFSTAHTEAEAEEELPIIVNA